MGYFLFFLEAMANHLYFLIKISRFRHGYCKTNPRKMVKTWAEKEMRNLSRLDVAGLPCPKPILLKSHVLLMSFIGNAGWPAPRLKVIPINTQDKLFVLLFYFHNVLGSGVERIESPRALPRFNHSHSTIIPRLQISSCRFE